MAELRANFDRLMAVADPPMTVVTTASPAERAGCLVGFHAQCSIDPPRCVIWLSKANHTHRVGLHASHFAVHYLTIDDHDVADLFGSRSGDDVDKFAWCAWTDHPEGPPLLDRCPNRLVGRRVAMLDEGSDHVCIVLEPVDASATDHIRALRLGHVTDIAPGHGNEERPLPPTERSTDS
jgi:flavin reductase (DIM6/NTAB) family NADH-FMN oxidoreductase RutF